MTDRVFTVFNDHAADYDGLRRRLIPPFHRFYGAAIEALALADVPIANVLDLGAGTGLLSTRVAAVYPEAHFTLLDGATDMLARQTLAERATPVVADLTDALPPGPFDAVVSALAIHHLSHDAKRDLYARVHDVLRPGGVFVNADQILGPTPRLEAAYQAWHAAACAELGATEQEWADTLERIKLDRRAPLVEQLTWLSEAGFADVDSLMQDHCFAVFAGRRAY
jgi:tRNA (cmo5U34)-methyltransferase